MPGRYCHTYSLCGQAYGSVQAQPRNPGIPHFRKRNFSMNLSKQKIAALMLLMLLGACGSTTGDRALSGGAIGAGVGAVGGAIVGGSPGTGALIGGAVGAATGGLTKQKDLDLGRPVWQ
jgi:osmotically inducible lipoprotein OsmB